MRIREGLLAIVPTTAAALIVAGSAASAPPGASYPWAQPGCALPTSCCTQPPASVPIGPATMMASLPGSSYDWAQPGYSVTTPGAQPPAWIPITSS